MVKPDNQRQRREGDRERGGTVGLLVSVQCLEGILDV